MHWRGIVGTCSRVAASSFVALSAMTPPPSSTSTPSSAFPVDATAAAGSSDFAAKYLHRLGMDPSDCPWMEDKASFRLTDLCKITQAHVETVPFENLGQHGGKGGIQSLDMATIEGKILDRNRGGFCFELNGLLARLLEEVGMEVTYVPAFVHRADPDNGDRGFDHPPTHLFLLVRFPPSTSDGKDGGDGDSTAATDDEREQQQQYFIDVGFGEPAMHPLKYPAFGEVQQTPEGMLSRFVKMDHVSNWNGNEFTGVVLEYFKDNEWKPRLMWDERSVDDSSTSMKLQDFQPMLEEVLQTESNFSRKIIVCRITQDTKYTLAGTKLKVTGPPRVLSAEDQEMKKSSGNDDEVVSIPVSTRQLNSIDEIRETMRSTFGIELDETDTLDLSRSLSAEEKVWASF
mmetsp:Transcript_1335/g.3275  ORF Transcript_1335/g.3275 Transcript_1335/m.3275 type:complete len:401 (+) Transcript_1335:110-1312(+)